jgi:P4 family phage/plasmid primase-like protien
MSDETNEPTDNQRGEPTPAKPKTKREIEAEAKALRAADREAKRKIKDAADAVEAARIATGKAEREARKAAEEAAKPRPAAVVDKDAQAKRFYAFLTAAHGSGRIHLRAISPKGVRVAYYDNADDFSAGVQEANRQGFNCYCGMNPFDATDERFAPRPLGTGTAVGNRDIVRRTHALIDGDAGRFEDGVIHPKGGKICTTDKEHDAALAMIQNVADFLIAEGSPPAALLMNDSGNGGSIVAGIDLPNTEEATLLIQKFLTALNQKFHTEWSHIDESVADAARITRIPGSVNCKMATKQRPNRPCYTLTPPVEGEAMGERPVISVEILNRIAGTAIEPKEEERDPSIEFHAIPEGERKEQLALVVAYLEDNGIKHRGFSRNEAQHFIAVELPHCLIKGSEHQSPGRAAVLVFDDGRIGYKCFSEQCNAKGWPVMQKSMKESFGDFCARAYNKTGLQFDDPLRLAKEFLKQTSTPEGLKTLAHFHNITRRHRNGMWEELERGENSPWVRAMIQDEQFKLAAHLSKMEGKEIKPQPVTTYAVNETSNTIDSLCKYEIDKDTTTPFWLTPYQNWQADDVLVFNNGFFNVHKWLDDPETPGEWFKPITPDLYYAYQAEFDFPLYAASTGDTPATPEWFKFLDSLQQSDAWRRQLRQMIGYLLWSGYNLQKFFHLYGPTRAGKGIVEKVVQDLGGGYHEMKLEAFAETFALENAVGKRLLVISETEDGPAQKNMGSVVRAIKAITGGSNKSEVNRKHVKNISVRLNCKIIADGQKRLRLTDSSGAVTARCIPLRYTISFLNKEDKALPDKLKLEYPAILLWALGGLRDLYQTHSFALCESTQKLLDEMHETNNPLQTFIEECCVVDSTKAVRKPSLFTIYEQWLEIENDDSLDKLNEKEFGTELPVIASTVGDGRMSKDTDTHYCDKHSKEIFEIVPTAFDVKGPKRPRLYTGIMPNEEWRKMQLNM